jgi:two-component system OmpR family sensor kinase
LLNNIELSCMAGLEAQQLVAAAAHSDSEVERLRRQVAELAAAVEARDTFIAVAAHELRNPMQPIIGHIELLLNGIKAGRCPPDQVELRLERVQRAMRHYMKRAGVLLDVSRINSGKLQLELEEIDIIALMRDVAADVADAARRAGSPISVTGPDTLPVTWDRLAIEQIVDNLVANAIKYGGGLPIELSAQAHGGDVHVQVRDHGSGIPAADRARVFERFERAVGPGERRSGFGVGLWLVRQLSEAMGGTVAIGDAPGGGALFTVRLPKHAAQAPS